MNDQPAPSQQTNPLGLAGFIVSLVGTCGTSGLLSPVGLIMSLIALKNEPRGFAVAGVVIGALGSCGILVALLLIPVAIGGVLLAAGLTGLAVALGGPQIEAQVEMGLLALAIEEYADDHGSFPTELADISDDLESDSGLLTDPWGNAYVLELNDDGVTYRIISMGEDGQIHTDDDISVDKTSAHSWTTTTPSSTSGDDTDSDADSAGDDSTPQ
jgi:hypothetical protein